MGTLDQSNGDSAKAVAGRARLANSRQRCLLGWLGLRVQTVGCEPIAEFNVIDALAVAFACDVARRESAPQWPRAPLGSAHTNGDVNPSGSVATLALANAGRVVR